MALSKPAAGATEPSSQVISRMWSCETLLRGSSFLAEQQSLQQNMTAEDVIAATCIKRKKASVFSGGQCVISLW